MYLMLVPISGFMIFLAPTRDRLQQVALEKRIVMGGDHFREGVFSSREADDVAALDEPDFGIIGPATDLLGRQDFEQLRVKGALIQQEG